MRSFKMVVVGCFVAVAGCLDKRDGVSEEVPSGQDSQGGEGEGDGEGDNMPSPPPCNPQAETCNYRDDDCDGQIDEELRCEAIVPHPCVDVKPNDIDFGRVVVRSETSADLAIINCGTSSVIVQEVNLQNDAGGQFSFRFADDRRGGRDLTLPSGERLLLFLFFTPQNVGRTGGSISIETKDPDRQFLIPLIGEGISANAPQLPVAVALAGILNSGNYQPYVEPARALRVEPETTIELRGSESFDLNADGRIVRYVWETTGQPDNADLPRDGRGRLSELADTTVRLPLFGQYIFQLTVENQFGLSATSFVYVVAEFANSTTIELTWGGDAIDLDLHFLHEGGEWFREPWDCHFANQNPEWGAAGEQNNPHLDQDCNGFQCGSETITVGELEPDVEYEIGAHLRFIRGNQLATFATVNIYRGGVMRYGATQRLEADSWWSVARLGAQAITPTDVLLEHPPR